MNPGEFPKQLSEAGKQLAAAGMNVDAALKYLQYAGLIQGDKVMGFINYDANVKAAAEREGKILWETANGLIQRGAGLQGKGIYGGNPSGLWKPSQQFGQFKELFEAAGYRGKDIGPFSSNSAWYKYSGQQLGDKVMRLTREAQPKLMYFGGKESDALRERLRSEYNQNGTFSLKSKTKDGKEIEKKFEYFLYKQPDGTNTVAMFGPHTGALGFASNRKLMEAAGEVAKELIGGGTVPRQIASAAVANVGPVNRAEPRNVAPVGKSVREKQVKAAVKEMKGESKPKPPQIDKGKQLAGVRTLAENFAKQGFSAVRIRDELKKLGVPPALITEVV
jgi:hypothetical protein